MNANDCPITGIEIFDESKPDSIEISKKVHI